MLRDLRAPDRGRERHCDRTGRALVPPPAAPRGGHAECTVGSEGPALEGVPTLVIEGGRRHEVPPAVARQLPLGDDPDDPTQRVGGPIPIPSARLLELPAVLLGHRTLGFSPRADQARRAAALVQLEVHRARDNGGVGRCVEHQIQLGERGEIPGLPVGADRHSAEHPGPAYPEGKRVGTCQPAPVHGLEPVADGDAVGCVGSQRRAGPESDRHRVPPIEAPGHGRLDREDAGRIHRPVQRPGDRAVERDGDGGRRRRPPPGGGPQDLEGGPGIGRQAQPARQEQAQPEGGQQEHSTRRVV